MRCELGLGQGWMWPVPQGTLPTLLLARCPRSSKRHSAVQSPSAFVLRCASLLPAHRAGPAWPCSPSPAALGDICACCCDSGGDAESPALIPGGWTDAAAGFTDPLARMGCPRRLCRAGDGSWGSGKDQTLGGLLPVPAWAPQPCSSWESAPPCHQSRTASPCQLCVAWGHVGTCSLPLDLSSHSGCPCPLADSGLGPCVGTDLAAPRRGGWAGRHSGSKPLLVPCPLTVRACPSTVPGAGAAPACPRTQGGNSSYFLK